MTFRLRFRVRWGLLIMPFQIDSQNVIPPTADRMVRIPQVMTIDTHLWAQRLCRQGLYLI